MQSPQSYPGRTIVENQILLPPAARTETGIGDPVTLDGFEVLSFQLEVTAAQSATEDLLDVFVQTTIDGVTWLDAVHFAQVLGDGGAKRFVSKLSAPLALTEYETGSALDAAAVRNIFGSQWRVRWEIVDDIGAEFTFNVKVNGT